MEVVFAAELTDVLFYKSMMSSEDILRSWGLKIPKFTSTEMTVRSYIDDYIWYKRYELDGYSELPEEVQKKIDPEQISTKKRKFFNKLEELVNLIRSRIEKGAGDMEEIEKLMDEVRSYCLLHKM